MRAFYTLFLMSIFTLQAMAADWNGELVIVEADGWRGGQSAMLKLECRTKRGNNVEAFTNRKATLQLTPQRFNLFAPEPLTLIAEGKGDGSFRFDLPTKLTTDYYHAVVLVSEDDGDLGNIATSLQDKNARRRLATQTVAIRGTDKGPFFAFIPSAPEAFFPQGKKFACLFPRVAHRP